MTRSLGILFISVLCLCNTATGQTINEWESLGGPIGNVLGLMVERGIIVAACWDQGLQRTTNLGGTWTRVSDGLGVTVEVRSIVRHPSGLLLAGTRFAGLLLSSDMGASWRKDTTPVMPDDITALTVLPSGTIVVGSGTTVLTSIDTARTWRLYSGVIPQHSRSFTTRAGSGELYCGASRGIFRSTDEGATWSSMLSGTDSEGFGHIISSPDGVLLATREYPPGFLRSLDGQSWTYVYKGFPGSTASLAVDSHGNTYFGSDGGLYHSANTGLSWHPLKIFNPASRISSIIIDDTGCVYLGTARQGAFKSVYSVWNFVTWPAELLYPLNGAMRLHVPTSLEWTRVPNAASHQIQVSTDSTFTSSVVLDTILSDTRLVGYTLQNRTRYWWRVRGLGYGGDGPWSLIWSFTTRRLTPPAPVPLFPPDGADSLTADIVLTWEPASDAESYTIQVAEDPLMQIRVAESDTCSLTHFAFHPDVASRTYYWRVRAGNVDTVGQWSTIRRFATASYSGAPILASPARGDTVLGSGVVMKWTAPRAWRTAVEVLVSKDSTFSLDVLKVTTSGPSTDSAYVRGVLPYARYYWKARCLWSYGAAGRFSDTWSFETKRGLPARPELVFPPDGADSLFASLRLSWQPVIDAETYGIEMSEEPRLQSNVTRFDSLTKASTILDQLPLNKTIYWRVRANNSTGSGSWSPIWSFITAPYSGRPILTDPPNGATTGAYALWFQWQTPLTWQPWSFLEIFTDSALTRRKTHRSTYKYGSVAEKIIELEKNTKYYWRVRFTWSYGAYSAYSDTWSFTTNDVVDVDQPISTSRPTHPVIAGNSPQPFTSYTDITFALPVQSTATLRIHDAL
ncbi:MAG: hypothetical protein HY962_04810, partial [Ignavibacteriae bacterium]|nr:hypothetical protein [Ignavibacteriota bacterium]